MYSLETQKAWEFVDELRTQNRRLCETLEFYANEDNYDRDSNGEALVDDGGGYRAKQALEDINSDDDDEE